MKGEARSGCASCTNLSSESLGTLTLRLHLMPGVYVVLFFNYLTDFVF